ncbi:MAG TPA: SRPBCC family protein [Steroidobacteraceae bacterium]|jgi:hypothetical protein
MAAVHIETPIRAPAAQVWKALAATGDGHLAFAGVLTACRMEREDLRIATFANGQTVKERIVSVEPQRMRIAYGVIESQFVHHSAAMQVIPRGEDECVFVWIADVLPHAAAAVITPLMEQGARALQSVMERPGSPPSRG